MANVFKQIGKLFGLHLLVNWSRTHSLPGFSGVPLFDVIRFTVFEMKRDSILIRAKSVAFSFMLSIFPSIIVVFSLIPFLPFRHFKETLLTSISSIIPKEAYGLVQHTVNEIINHQNRSVLSISLLLAAFYSARGVLGLMNSFDKALPTFRKRNGFNKYMVSLKITLMLFFM